MSPLIWVAVFVILSGFFSGSETAFISINRLRLHANLAQRNLRSRWLDKLLKYPEDMIGAFLLGTNTCVVAAALMLSRYLEITVPNPEWVPLWTTLILTPLILLFSDVLPKIIFRTFADGIMHGLVWLYAVLFIILFPFQFLFVRSTKFILKVLGLAGKKGGRMSRDEFKLLLDISAQRGTMKNKEKEFIESVMNFKNIRSREIMIPLIRMVCVEENDTVTKASQMMLTSRHSRLPVYRARVDNIIGYVENKDILFAKKNHFVKSYIKTALYVPEALDIDKLMVEMQESSSPMVFTVDEYGGVSGVITTQDMVTEIVGEFVEMENERSLRKEGDNYIVDGLLDIDELDEELHLGIVKEDFETVAGFMIHKLEKIPKAGDGFNYRRYYFEVIEKEGRRIAKVRISPKNKNKNSHKLKARKDGKKDV